MWFIFGAQRNAIAESVWICVKNANVASKAYKWDEMSICVYIIQYTNTKHIGGSEMLDFGVSHLLDNSLRSNHRRCECQRTGSVCT